MSATAQTAAVRSALCLVRLSSSGLTAAELIGLLRRLRRARTQLPAARFAAASEYTGTKRRQANTAATAASVTGADAEIQFVAPAFTSEDWLVLEAQLKPFVLCVLGRYRLRGRAQAAAVDLLLVDSEAVSDSNMRLAAYSGTTATAATAAAAAAVANGGHSSVYTSSPRVFYLQELQWYFEQQAPSRRRSEELPHALHALIGIHNEAAGTGISSSIATYNTTALPVTAAATVTAMPATAVVAAAAAAAVAPAATATTVQCNANSSSSSAAAHRARLCRDALLSAVTAVPTFTLLADEQQGDVVALARHFAACQTSSETALAKLRHSFERRYAVEPPPLVDTRITLVSAASATATAAADGTAAATAAATAVVPQVTYHLLTAGDTPLLKGLHSEGSAVLLSIAVFAHSHLGLTAAAQCLAESAVCMMLGVRSLSSKELSRVAHVHTPALQLLRGLDFLAHCYLAHAVAMHELIVGEHPQQQQGLYCGTLQTEPEQSELVQRRHEAAAAAAAAALAAVREEELNASGQQREQHQQQQSSTLQHKKQLKAAVRAVDFASKLKAAAALARSNTAASVASADDAQAAAVAQQHPSSTAKRRRAVPKHAAAGADNTAATTATTSATASKQQQQNTIQAVAAALLQAAVPGG
eukprot:4303-Heterococcus_DN1.PRE.1